MELKQFSLLSILKDVQLEYEVILNLETELLGVITNCPINENKEKYIHSFLDEKMKSIDLTKSFQKKLIILYQETLYPEIMLGIHSWFYTKAANIENILFVTTHSIGLKEWYNSYLNLFGVTGFKIVEAPMTAELYKDRWLQAVPQLNKNELSKQIKYLFTYYGGRYGSRERDFLVALLSMISNSFVDYWGGFSTLNDEFENYAEQFTNFLDRDLVDRLITSRLNKTDNEIERSDEATVSTGIIKLLDSQSACQVIRETHNLMPFSNFTEKTIRGFLNLQFVIPISGYKSISYIEDLGFKFSHNIINYDYQFESNIYKRTMMLVDELNRLNNQYDLSDWQEIIYDNSEILCYNYNYWASGSMMAAVRKKVLEDIHG